MRSGVGGLLVSATDLANFIECEHLVSLERRVARGDLKRPHFPDPTREVLEARGLEHERRYLESLQARFGGELTRVEIFDRARPDDWADAARETLAAIRRGATVVYQGAFVESQWIARPDFLVRTDRPSQLGPWSYEVVDTKLARTARPHAVVQLCIYSEMLAQAQGTMPHSMRIVLGRDAGEENFRVADYLAYVRRLTARG